MIESISGTLEAVSPENALLRLGGITLRIAISHTTAQSLGRLGGNATLYTYLHFREEVLALYGFGTTDERDLFMSLLRVNGVGPRLALAVCSLLPPARLSEAIKNGDAETLSRVPGIGKRLAGRLILELRGTLSEQQTAPAIDSELLSALLSLGYTRSEANHALESLPPEATRLAFEDRLREALRSFIPR